MKKKILALCLLLTGWALPPFGALADGRIEAPTSVERVTLFIDGAQVTRTCEATLPAGVSTLLFRGLSHHLDEKSLRINAHGPFTVASVERRFGYADSVARTERQTRLGEALREAEGALRRLDAACEVIDAEEELLRTNCSAGGGAALSAARELTAFYAERLGELKRRRIALDDERRTLTERRQSLQRELAQVGGRDDLPMSEVEVRVEAPAPCRARFALTYYVRHAGWFPSYDLRSEGLSHPVELVYKAHVFQHTGERWDDVALTLSSSDPSLGSVAPQLKTYWLDFGLAPPRYDLGVRDNAVAGRVTGSDGEPLVGATVSLPGRTLGTVTDVDGRYRLTLPGDASELSFSYVGYEPVRRPIAGSTLDVVLREDRTCLDEVVVTAYGSAAAGLEGQTAGVRIHAAPRAARGAGLSADDDLAEASAPSVAASQTRMGYEFAVERPYTIASGGLPLAVEIGRFSLPADYAYTCVPKVDRDAFLTASIRDWERLNLLQGEVSVYFEETFVGKSLLDPMQAADTLRFSLGRDRGIVVERTRQSDFVGRRTIGSGRVQEMVWRIVVRNTRAEEVSLTLCDQLPVSRNGEITVTARELSGGRCDAATGRVEWDLRLRPGERREIVLHYAVRYPRGRRLVVE